MPERDIRCSEAHRWSAALGWLEGCMAVPICLRNIPSGHTVVTPGRVPVEPKAHPQSRHGIAWAPLWPRRGPSALECCPPRWEGMQLGDHRWPARPVAHATMFLMTCGETVTHTFLPIVILKKVCSSVAFSTFTTWRNHRPIYFQSCFVTSHGNSVPFKLSSLFLPCPIPGDRHSAFCL